MFSRVAWEVASVERRCTPSAEVRKAGDAFCHMMQSLDFLPRENVGLEVPATVVETLPLWQLDIAEVTGHNLEARSREEVNRMLQEGWILLHIYTLKYEEDGVWRERPMAILGRPRKDQPSGELK
jgi:hypothetical protein